MSHHATSPSEELAKRFCLWLELASSLEKARAALLAGDLGELEKQTANQLRLYSELRPLAEFPASPDGIEALARSLGTITENSPHEPLALPRAVGPEAEEETRRHLLQLQERVRYLARLHAALLRVVSRSARTVAHLLARENPTYSFQDPEQICRLEARE